MYACIYIYICIYMHINMASASTTRKAPGPPLAIESRDFRSIRNYVPFDSFTSIGPPMRSIEVCFVGEVQRPHNQREFPYDKGNSPYA